MSRCKSPKDYDGGFGNLPWRYRLLLKKNGALLLGMPLHPGKALW